MTSPTLEPPRLEGIDQIVKFMDEEAAHPKTHMMTNIYIDEVGEQTNMFFRIVALLGKGFVGTASYYDEVVKTPSGWRVKNRIVTIKRRDKREAKVDLNS